LRTAVTLFALFSFVASGLSQSRRFSADDTTKIVRISDQQISPDGKTISIVVGRANLKEDRWDSEIDFVEVATKAVRVMTRDRAGAASVRWSPTGDRIAYLAQDGEKKAQIFVMPVNGGESVQVTRSKTPVTVIAWRPDGQALAYTAADEVPERKDEAKFDDAFEVGNNSYLERAAAKPVHLWTVTMNGEAKRLTSGSWSLPVHMAPGGPPPPIAYTQDGRSIVFVRAESPITGDSDSARLQVADAATGATRPLTKSAVAEGNVMLSPDGTQVAYASSRDGKRGNEETVYVVPVAGGAGRDVAAALDRGIGGAVWMPDGKALLLAANDGTKVAYWVQPLDGPAKRVALGSLCPSPAVNVGKDGAVALTATDATHPPELFYMAHVGDAPVQMTHLQTVTDGVTLGKQETLTWKSDKLDVDGVLTYPPDYVAGKKYPLVLYIHGGPTATSLETFTPAAQILAAQGWLVLESNYRGSNNEGNAFETAIVNDASAGPGRDIMAGVKAIENRGIVDEKRIAVSGWSYGGQMASWMIGNYPEVWKAAVAGAPVTDLVDQYSLSDNNVQRVEHYGPSPFVGDNLKSYAAQSPITYAWRVKAPTLIMSDVGDWRVTTTQAYKLYHALKDNGVTVKFVAFPVPGHSPSDPLRSRDVWRRWTAWLAQYLNEPASTTPGGM
jgi:dipeptidyl aminopeptidase/acylaminoacyl peptidase